MGALEGVYRAWKGLFGGYPGPVRGLQGLQSLKIALEGGYAGSVGVFRGHSGVQGFRRGWRVSARARRSLAGAWLRVL